MAEIMGTVTSVKRYLSPEKIELKISPDLGGESTIILQQNRKYIIPDFQREIRWEENNLSILLSDLSTSPRFLGNIILTIKKDGDCQIIDGQQRTTVLLLILAYIKSRYKEKLEPFTPCSIENRSFTGLSELMENGFADELLENPDITKTDYYGQRQSFINLPRLHDGFRQQVSADLLRHCKSLFGVIGTHRLIFAIKHWLAAVSF